MKDLEEAYREVRGKHLVPMASEVRGLVAALLEGHSRIDQITARAKGVERFVEKALKKDDDGKDRYPNPLQEIQDQIGARVVVFYLSDVEAVAETLKKHFRVRESKKVQPEQRRAFGYVGQHFIFWIPKDVRGGERVEDDVTEVFELQVKTLFQHAWAEAEHDVGYKERELKVPLTDGHHRALAFTASQAWGADQVFDNLIAGRPPLGGGAPK